MQSIRTWMPAWKQSDLTQVWNITERARQDHPVADDAGLGIWLVHAPWMHPAWCWHYVGLIHLRPLPNQSKAPTITRPDSTHEFIVFALDPDCDIDLTPNTKLLDLRFLQPVSIVQQFTARNDAEALGTIEHALEQTLYGHMTLDSDGRAMWRHYLTGEK